MTIGPKVIKVDTPLSTFSVDVDSASYANVRRFLNDGRLPPLERQKLRLTPSRNPWRRASVGCSWLSTSYVSAQLVDSQ